MDRVLLDSASGLMADAAAYVPGGRCVCTHQVTALLCVKWRHGRHVESVTSNRKSGAVNRCVHSYLKNDHAKFRPNPIWNDGALGFFEEIAPTHDESRYEINSWYKKLWIII